jgi:hypothetical protein
MLVRNFSGSIILVKPTNQTAQLVNPSFRFRELLFAFLTLGVKHGRGANLFNKIAVVVADVRSDAPYRGED